MKQLTLDGYETCIPQISYFFSTHTCITSHSSRGSNPQYIKHHDNDPCTMVHVPFIMNNTSILSSTN